MDKESRKLFACHHLTTFPESVEKHKKLPQFVPKSQGQFSPWGTSSAGRCTQKSFVITFPFLPFVSVLMGTMMLLEKGLVQHVSQVYFTTESVYRVTRQMSVPWILTGSCGSYESHN